MHGKSSPVHHDNEGLYSGLTNPFIAGRYHSLAVDDVASAGTPGSGTHRGREIMGLRHHQHLAFGVHSIQKAS